MYYSVRGPTKKDGFSVKTDPSVIFAESDALQNTSNKAESLARPSLYRTSLIDTVPQNSGILKKFYLCRKQPACQFKAQFTG